jgi:hypothetical protein
MPLTQIFINTATGIAPGVCTPNPPNQIYNGIGQNITQPCPDHYVGYFEVNSKGIVPLRTKLWFARYVLNPGQCSYQQPLIDLRSANIINPLNFPKKANDKVVVVVVESPHKDEYDANNFTFLNFPNQTGSKQPSPAIGQTGTNLQYYFDAMINAIQLNPALILANGTYHVILCNPIQYQCSLGLPPKNPPRIRDKIWRRMWKYQKVKNDFIICLLKYNPDIIFNFCTYNFRCRVQKEIDITCGAATLYQGNKHPSIWSQGNQTIYAWTQGTMSMSNSKRKFKKGSKGNSAQF